MYTKLDDTDYTKCISNYKTIKLGIPSIPQDSLVLSLLVQLLLLHMSMNSMKWLSCYCYILLEICWNKLKKQNFLNSLSTELTDAMLVVLGLKL